MSSTGESHAQQFSAPPPHGRTPEYPPVTEPRGTDGLAIAGFVLGLLGLVLLAVPFCIVALRRIRRSHAGGRGLAIAGLVISTLWVVLIGVVVAAVLAFTPARNESGAIVEEGRLALSDLRVGDCIKELAEGDVSALVQVLPCTDPHAGELGLTFDLPAGKYPGDEAARASAEDGCVERLTGAAKEAVTEETAGLVYVYPREVNWRLDDRKVLCFFTPPGSETSITGSVLEGTVK